MEKDMRKRKGNLLKKMMAVFLSVILVMGMLVTDLPQSEAYAAGDIFDSGTDWTLDSDGTLTITSDTGMADWIDKQTAKNKVTKVVIENGVTNIGQKAFSGCIDLTEVTIPNTVTSIGSSAFEFCSMTNVTIPDSVTSIGDSAFAICSSLTEVTIPDSVTRIEARAFYNCSRLTSMQVEGGNTVYDSRENCNAIIETDSNTLIAGCSKTVIPDSVTSIGAYAFYVCRNLTAVTIPDSVTSIGQFAFDQCSGLTKVTIPDSVTSIGECAFSSCNGLTSMKVDEGNTVYDSRENCNAIIETSSNKLIAGCGETVIPDSVTSIGRSAFYYCSSLTEVEIPDSVISIETRAFYACSGLTEVTIPDSVTSIGSSAFYVCRDLTEVTISDSVTDIGGKAFSGCSSLIKVTMLGSIPPTCGMKAFEQCKFVTEDRKGIHAPEGKAEDYKAAWTEWVDYIADDAGHTHLLTHHPVVAATCTATGTGEYWACEDCNKLFSDANAQNEINAVPILDKLEHSYGDWITDQEATENEAGTKHRSCSVCGYQDIQIIPAMGHTHSLIHHPAVAATCTMTGTGEYWACEGCNKLFSDANAQNEINAVPILDKLMHNYGNWTSVGNGTHIRSCQNAGCSQSETENCSGGTATYTERAICETCGGRYGEFLADTVAPKGEIRIATNRWASFLHTITFDLFFKKTEEVTITAEDQESGVAVVGYYISDEGLEEDAVREIHDWIPGNTDTTTFQISPDKRCVIYAKVIDCQGNVTYISSDGLEFDGTEPVISGIRDGESYCGPQVVTVTDNSGLDTVKVGEETVILQEGKFTLQAASGMQSVTASDKAGNSTTVTVIVNDGHSFGDWITDQEATENEAGTKHRDCSVCGYKDTQIIPATGSGNGSGDNRPVDNEGKPINAVKGDEPKTGDNTRLELYATLAMISGLSYLLLYFADRRKGMTEETKKELVSRLARWAKRGGKIRKLLALVAIFGLLVYYHSIGKKTVVEWEDVYGE